MNTLENKAKFFAQYWGQKVIKCALFPNELLGVCQYSFPQLPIDESKKWDKDWLELKPLSNISDEDARFLMYGRTNKELKAYYHGDISWFEKDVYKDSFKLDYLRSKGYALDWNGITVEQQLEYGWIKLKDNE